MDVCGFSSIAKEKMKIIDLIPSSLHAISDIFTKICRISENVMMTAGIF